MANSTTALQNGFIYQARVFWLHVFDLLIPATHVSEVQFEASQPKAFDDVVTRFETPLPRGGPERIAAECHQVKWHVHSGGRFGFADLADPERLRDAQAAQGTDASFVLVTTDRIRDDDPLAELVSKNDHSLLIERLFSTKTDQSRMGEVRRCWREHLNLGSDDELRPIIGSLRVVDGYRSLEELRREVNTKAVAVGLKPCDEARSDFRYDSLAHALRARQLNQFSKASLETVLKEEGLWLGRTGDAAPAPTFAIHSFLGLATDLVPTAPENALFLTDLFRQRYLADGRDWQKDIKPRAETFLQHAVSSSNRLRLVMNAHASIAYLAGSILHVKSGVDADLLQKGRVGGIRTWRADDQSQGAALKESVEQLGNGPDIAVGLSLTRDVESDIRMYVDRSLPDVGHLVLLEPTSGHGQQSVAGGQHAAMLAEQAARCIRRKKSDPRSSTVHLFAACPNSFLFYLGQENQAIGPVIVYEFDFDGEGNRGYMPTFTIG